MTIKDRLNQLDTEDAQKKYLKKFVTSKYRFKHLTVKEKMELIFLLEQYEMTAEIELVLL